MVAAEVGGEERILVLRGESSFLEYISLYFLHNLSVVYILLLYRYLLVVLQLLFGRVFFFRGV